MMSRQFPLAALGWAAGPLLHVGAAARAGLYRSGWVQQKRLRTKVVSVGNISWGGTGKTPFVIWLADRLSAAGLRVSILTRAYRRASSDPVRVFRAGTPPVDAVNDGDEVQLYLRHLRNVAVGISGSRYDTGRQLESQMSVDVHLLDDGFQHLALARDVDLVLIDASNPWGARAGFSRLLRESPRALGRASAVILTHCEAAGPAALESVQAAVRDANPAAPQFRASTHLFRFASPDGTATSMPSDMRGLRCVAFCGIGSPQHFIALLKANGVECAGHKLFSDHHSYDAGDVNAIEQLIRSEKADCVITTEKDLVNLKGYIAFSVPLYWAQIEFQLEQEDAFLAWLGERLGAAMIPSSRAQRAPAATRV